MEHPDIRFSTWRQQRAAEHLRQQHERHSLLPDGTIIVDPFDMSVGHVGDAPRHLPPGSVEPFVRKNSPHLRSADNSESRETRKQVQYYFSSLYLSKKYVTNLGTISH